MIKKKCRSIVRSPIERSSIFQKGVICQTHPGFIATWLDSLLEGEVIDGDSHKDSINVFDLFDAILPDLPGQISSFWFLFLLW